MPKSCFYRSCFTTLPPAFLAPALFAPKLSPRVSQFSTTSPNFKRKKRIDGNPDRGISALRRTGPKRRLAMDQFPLPEPVMDVDKRPALETDKDHGLWGFFNKDRTLLTEPLTEGQHGRSCKHLKSNIAHTIDQAEDGRRGSYETNPGRTYTRSGIIAARKGTGSRPRQLSASDWKPAPERVK